MHSYVYQMLVVLLIVVLLLTIAGLVFDLKLDYSYLQGIEDRGREGGWWSFILLFLKKVGHNIVLLSHAVPMSIYVAIELLKVFQKKLLDQIITVEMSKAASNNLDTLLDRISNAFESLAKDLEIAALLYK